MKKAALARLLSALVTFMVSHVTFAGVVNGTFEDGATGWTGLQPEEVVNQVFTPELILTNGTNFLGVQGNSDTDVRVVSQVITLLLGQTLNVETGFATTTSDAGSTDVGMVTINGQPVVIWKPSDILPGHSTGGFLSHEIFVDQIPGVFFGTPFVLGFEVRGTGSVLIADNIVVNGMTAPVPLPATAGLLLIGLIAIASKRRQRSTDK